MAQNKTTPKNNTKVKDINYYKKKFWKIFFYAFGGIFLFQIMLETIYS